MAIRDGMEDLIKRVRSLTGAENNEYSVDVDSYWTDQHIQDVLDANSRFLVDAALEWEMQTIGGGTAAYYTCLSGWRDFEEAASGTARWIVRDATGTQQGTANYTADYRSGRLTFTSDQGGTAYYLTAYTYDVHAAAADVWLQRMSHFSQWYDFTADGQNLSRSQAWEHARLMEERMRAKAGANVSSRAGGDLRVAQFVRRDING